MTVGIVVAVVVVILVVLAITMYNGLVKLRNNRENAFSNIEVQLKQRYDLVPQLVNTVQGYATHEKETLERVTAARAAAMGARTIDEKVAADKALTGALAGLKVSLEAYPELKANHKPLPLHWAFAVLWSFPCFFPFSLFFFNFNFLKSINIFSTFIPLFTFPTLLFPLQLIFNVYKSSLPTSI